MQIAETGSRLLSEALKFSFRAREGYISIRYLVRRLLRVSSDISPSTTFAHAAVHSSQWPYVADSTYDILFDGSEDTESKSRHYQYQADNSSHLRGSSYRYCYRYLREAPSCPSSGWSRDSQSIDVPCAHCPGDKISEEIAPFGRGSPVNKDNAKTGFVWIR